jgi:hypothetical protein
MHLENVEKLVIRAALSLLALLFIAKLIFVEVGSVVQF